MRAIVLTRGRIATVDDEDFDRVNQFKWHALKKGRTYYAARTVLEGGKKRHEKLHQFILGAIGVDHRDGDGLNCRGKNLRVATQQQNLQGHRRKVEGVSSQYRGVSWYQPSKKWRAKIKVSRKQIHLGHFEFEIQAAKAYDVAARRLFRDFASPNFP